MRIHIRGDHWILEVTRTAAQVGSKYKRYGRGGGGWVAFDNSLEEHAAEAYHITTVTALSIRVIHGEYVKEAGVIPEGYT